MTSCFGGILLPVLAVFYFRLWRWLLAVSYWLLAFGWGKALALALALASL